MIPKKMMTKAEMSKAYRHFAWQIMVYLRLIPKY